MARMTLRLLLLLLIKMMTRMVAGRSEEGVWAVEWVPLRRVAAAARRVRPELWSCRWKRRAFPR